MKYLLPDTNIVSDYFGGNRRILQLFAGFETTLLSAIVMGELEAGFRGENRYMENLEIVERFLDKNSVAMLDVGRDTAEVFGRVKQQLREGGTPIPLNDVWIASQAIEKGAILATYDNHFSHINGVRLWDRP